jgi:hypothetical protein
MPEIRMYIRSHTHDVSACFSAAAGERFVLLMIGSQGEQNPPVYAFKPEQARELARRLQEMADAFDASQN